MSDSSNIRKSKRFGSIHGYFVIFRPVNSILASLATFIGILIAIGFNSLSLYLSEIVLAMFVTFCIAAGGYTINDYFDFEIDKINQPERALPIGLIRPEQAYIFAMGLFSLGLILSIVLAIIEKADNIAKIVTPFLALLGIFFLYSYGLYFKRIGGVGNVIVTALVLIPFIFGGIIVNNFITALYPSILTTTIMLGREIIKDVEDIEGDTLGAQSKTLPVILGVKNTTLLGHFFLILFLLFSPTAFFMSEVSIYHSWGLLVAVCIVDALILYILLTFRGSEKELRSEEHTS